MPEIALDGTKIAPPTLPPPGDGETLLKGCDAPQGKEKTTMVPKFEDREEMVKFLQENLQTFESKLSATDVARLLLQFLLMTRDDGEIEALVSETVEQEVTDALESIEFKSVDLQIVRG